MRTAGVALLPTRRSRTFALPAPEALEALGQPETAKEIAAKYYRGLVSERWVLAHHAPEHKRFMGRNAVWYELHSREFVASDQATRRRASR